MFVFLLAVSLPCSSAAAPCDEAGFPMLWGFWIPLVLLPIILYPGFIFPFLRKVTSLPPFPQLGCLTSMTCPGK